jgi:hypothetical protein
MARLFGASRLYSGALRAFLARPRAVTRPAGAQADDWLHNVTSIVVTLAQTSFLSTGLFHLYDPANFSGRIMAQHPRASVRLPMSPCDFTSEGRP